MKRLLLILILTFSFQSLTKADDIKDFKIEGMSIGDSALDYFKEEDINSNKEDWYKNNEFSSSEFPNFKTSYFGNLYETLQISYRTKDKKYIIKGVTGILLYENNIKNCYKKMDTIVDQISELFKDVSSQMDKLVEKHAADKSGNSITTSVDFYFDNGSWMYVSCFDWSKDIGYTDNLRIHLGSSEFADFLNTKAYN